jgi:SAM-dependent methyltransferase
MKESVVRLIRGAAKKVIPRPWRPGPYLRATARRMTNNVVWDGPFRGMKYIEQSHCSALFPKLLGLYEMELHREIEAACRLSIDRIIDIGSAEGYYAAGFALRRPDVQVVAFELDPVARQLAQELFALNGLDGRITVRGKCEPDDLADLTNAGVSLIICDCEGDENVLLDPARVTGLARSFVLVETHEFVIPGVTDQIQRRFAATHDIEVIWQRYRRREEFPLSDWYIRRMQDLDLDGVMSEDRPIRMQWLWMTPTAGQPARS